jgi:hypothetical protein
MDPEKRVIQSNQDVHVCGYEEWSGYIVEVVMNGVNGNGENLILLLEHGNNFARKHGLSYSSLFF